MIVATINSETLRESIETISALVVECRVHFESDQVYVRAVDSANVAMVCLHLDRQAFIDLDVTPGEIGLDIARFKNIFSMLGKAEKVTLHLPDKENKIKVSFLGYQYAITLLEAATIKKDPNPPNIELPGKIVIKGSYLYSAIRAAAVVSDKVWFGISPQSKGFFMSAEGDSDHIRREFSSEELISVNDADVKSLFSIDYLKEMGKVLSNADEVTISLGDNHPIKFSFDIAGGAGHVEYLLAPRIEAE
ncbi:MAG: DNA polymerase sliding clamp [Methanospirillaceae archaeon]|nr:DNA polymerase sliding clamp [Methanospirillaceae archaeon]